MQLVPADCGAVNSTLRFCMHVFEKSRTNGHLKYNAMRPVRNIATQVESMSRVLISMFLSILARKTLGYKLPSVVLRTVLFFTIGKVALSPK